MDLNKTIRDLRNELEKLNEVIASLEQFQSTGTLPAPRRRGRKSMPEEERKVVAERMKRYWARPAPKEGRDRLNLLLFQYSGNPSPPSPVSHP
jgi:hypothetical protein